MGEGGCREIKNEGPIRQAFLCDREGAPFSQLTIRMGQSRRTHSSGGEAAASFEAHAVPRLRMSSQPGQERFFCFACLSVTSLGFSFLSIVAIVRNW